MVSTEHLTLTSKMAKSVLQTDESVRHGEINSHVLQLILLRSLVISVMMPMNV